MKKAILMLILGMLTALLTASVGISSVRMEDHSGAVCRVVISLSEESRYQFSESSEGLWVSFDNFDTGTKARIYAETSELITSIEQHDEVLKMLIGKPFRYETMNFEYPRRLVVDVFMRSPNRAQRMAIAAFYSEMGKYNSADREYGALDRDYRNDDQILYQWSMLLAKRHSSRALDKLSLIPEKSPYHARALKLLERLQGKAEIQEAVPEMESPALDTSITPDMQTPEHDTVVASPTPEPSKPVVIPPEKITGLPSWQLPLFVALCLLALIVVIATIRSLGTKRPSKMDLLNDDPPIATENEADNKTLIRMVSKLLDDGWTHKEIARELKISNAQVERLIQFSHTGRKIDDET